MYGKMDANLCIAWLQSDEADYRSQPSESLDHKHEGNTKILPEGLKR